PRSLRHHLRNIPFAHAGFAPAQRYHRRYRLESDQHAVTMIYHVTHTTTYKYTDPVTLCYSEAHLRPRDTRSQDCLAFSFTIEPTPCVSTQRLDFFGNHVQAFSIQELHRTLTVTSASTIEVVPQGASAEAMAMPWERAREAARL